MILTHCKNQSLLHKHPPYHQRFVNKNIGNNPKKLPQYNLIQINKVRYVCYVLEPNQ